MKNTTQLTPVNLTTESKRPFAQSSLSVLRRHLKNSAEGSAFQKAVQAELAIRGRQTVHNTDEFFNLISRSKRRRKLKRPIPASPIIAAQPKPIETNPS